MSQHAKRFNCKWKHLLLVGGFPLSYLLVSAIFQRLISEDNVSVYQVFVLDKIATKTHKMLKKAFDDDALDQTQTYDRL